MTAAGQDPTERAASRKTVGDGALTVAERAIAQIAQLVVFILAARLLGPAEFGVFALVSAAAIITMRIAEAAWGPIIMSSSGDRDVIRQVLFLSVVSGGIFMLISLGAVELYALRNDDPEILWLMRLFALWIWLATIASAQKGVLIQRAQLKSSAICEITGELIGAATSIALLLSGWGVLALVFGRLAFQCTYLLCSFFFTRLVPMLAINREVLADIWKFTLQIFVSRVFIHVRLYIATFIVGAFLGPAAVGYYRLAERLVGALAELVAVPGQLLAWTMFRQARDAGPPETKLERINAALARYTKGMVAFGVPPLLWLMVMSDSLISGLLTSEWLPAAPIVAILAFARLLMLLGVAAEPLMALTGSARVLPYYTGMVFAASFTLTLIGAQFGLYAIAVAQVGLATVVLFATIWIYHRFLETRWSDIQLAVRPVVLPLAIAAGTLFLLERQVAPVSQWGLIFEAVGLGLVAVPIYLLALALFDRVYLRHLAASVFGGRGAHAQNR